MLSTDICFLLIFNLFDFDFFNTALIRTFDRNVHALDPQTLSPVRNSANRT